MRIDFPYLLIPTDFFLSDFPKECIAIYLHLNYLYNHTNPDSFMYPHLIANNLEMETEEVFKQLALLIEKGFIECETLSPFGQTFPYKIIPQYTRYSKTEKQFVRINK